MQLNLAFSVLALVLLTAGCRRAPISPVQPTPVAEISLPPLQSPSGKIYARTRVQAFSDLGNVLDTLILDATMRAMNISKASNSGRLAQEQRFSLHR